VSRPTLRRNYANAIIVETFAAPGPNDKDRCLGASSVEFPEIPNAKGYRVIAKDVKYGAGTMDQVGPPVPADHRVYGPAHWDAPAHFHRFALSAASTGQGCAQVILGAQRARPRRSSGDRAARST
jgi:hypothetical protein